MPGAITMYYDYDEASDTGDPEDDALPLDDTSGFMDDLLGGGAQLINSIMGGGKGQPAQGGGIGEGIGTLAGGALGTLAGGAGASLGAALGKAAGGAVERLIRTQTTNKKRPPAKKPAPVKKAPPHPKRLRIPTKRERKMLVEAEQMSKRTGEIHHLTEARLRVYRPAEYKRRRDAGLLWSQMLEAEEPKLPAPTSYGGFDESPYLNESYASYREKAAPETRPQPRRHISTVPMTQEQLAALVRAVPLLQTLDQRLLRTMSGSASVARDVSGVDPTTGIYHALPGETPHGITKKLTGQVERTQELLAANPGKHETATEWNIPPGWLQYAKETGAPTFITARKYTVLLNDTPIGIAKKMGAFDNRPKWWSELKAANPHKPTQSGTGNWVSLYPNEEIGIPDAWPETHLAVPVELPTPGNEYEPPGLPAPGKTTTLDPGVVLHAQALLAKWAAQNPSDCNPSDYGRNPTDLLSGVTPRTTQALSSFQTWWNKKHPTRALNTTGELDAATYHALVEADNAANAPAPSPQQSQPAPAPQQPTPAPSANTQPAPTNGAPAGWPKELPWPFPPTNTAPQQPEQPQQPTPAPSANTQPAPAGWPKELPWPFPPTNTAPQQPEQPQQPTPAPSANTQPAPTNGVPAGWPKELPWPFPPTNTAPQQPEQPQQPTPAPSANTQPAPTNGAPAGWPKEWQWPFPPTNTVPEQPKQPGPGPGTDPADAPRNTGPYGTNTPAAPSPSGSGPQLDNHLTPREREEVIAFLAHGKDADQMDRVANDFAREGYPLTASALRVRANELRANSMENPPPVVFMYNPDAPSGPATEEKSGSVLPVLAVLGAGLVLS